MYKQRVKEAIEAFKNGEMIIIMDDEDRENEGDLVYAGIFSTPQKVNFMAQEARGLICVSLTQELANRFELTPMVSCNDSNHCTAFTISIDAREATTGISAFERDMTIRLLCDPQASARDFVRPGHIFPLVAKEGGVLVRTGHTEASVDLCKIAGIAPIAVICEMMKEDGSMARRGDKFLVDFAHKHQLKILYISDLVQYRLAYENLLSPQPPIPSTLLGKECQRIDYVDHLQRTHSVFVFDTSRVSSQPLVKFFHIGKDVDFLSDLRAYQSLVGAMELISKDWGVLIFLQTQNELKGKEFGIGAQILKSLQISDFRFISSKKEVSQMGFGGFGVNITEVIALGENL
ncbi:bifunctional 3,4-dihydroxy-2-butanone 4-phosphate synthase/GTP cyclohydrolase II [Helicobacter enhydrae]|uniref:3,4-dihydroxy-2-butanone 4-phosphate synthase n=1 Tax=Helicobacter enhydrae TaxID=222136 RepID=A0A1B1U5J6_9HELI|nr:bifunctional 3,4-dihydroxy-2-butanone 4-phosphate synthase/GTP cyclohydrolase II [Helicobacter enhydrae]ANV98036.1 bifunctional 3,4-dihydroxy-2-butanone 4-phosphate synthase/GTP cyclohydrolase II [Helicobacter enhydrae]